MRADPFACPHCLGHLTETPVALACQGCAQTFPLWHGVPNFGAKTDYYYGEFPQPIMRSIIETAVQRGSAKAFEDALKGKTDDWRRYFLHYATDETRAAWQFLLHLPENGTVLDMGCGWGNLSISLARNFATVYAMDLVPERAAISGVRAREAGLQNVRALAGGNTDHLPFLDSCLDAVVLNGVLEWVATSFPQIADPREAQVQVLREVARVLKPDGQVYIGIENRLGFLYFLGRPDEHSKLRFTTLLPRWLANRCSRARRRQPYRTYTYSWRGYRKLLREAGLTDARFYCPFPEYREFSELVDLDRPQNLTRALHPTSLFGRMGLQVCKRVNLLREFSPSYSIVASKTPGLERFVDRLLRHINVAAGDNLHLHVTRTAAALLFTPGVVVRLPLTARAQMRMNVEAANLKEIGSRRQPLIPEPIATGEFQGQTYLATPVFFGGPGVKLARRERNRAAVSRQAADFITDFHRVTRREQVCTDEWLQKNFDWLVDYVCALGVDVGELKALCRRDLLGKRVVSVTSHGDFSLKNLVFEPQACKLTGVVDWDLTDFDGWPASDLVNLFVVLQYENHSNTFNEAALTVLKRLRDNDGVERELLASYLATLQVDPEQVVWSLQRYLLRILHDKYEYGDRKTAPLMAALDAQLAAARLLTREWLADHWPNRQRTRTEGNDARSMQQGFLCSLCWVTRTFQDFPARWRLVAWLESRDTDFSTTSPRTIGLPFGYRMTLDPRNFDARMILISGAPHHGSIPRVFSCLLQPGDSMLDVGANIGFFSLLGVKLVGPTGCVHTFEASPSIVQQLKHNLAQNPTQNTVLHEKAVSDQVGFIEFHTAGAEHLGISSIRDLGTRTASTTRVPTVTIDSLLDEIPPVKLAKIDVEGAELMVLRGMTRLIQRDQPYLILEFSDAYLREMGSDVHQMRKFLAKASYTLYRVDWDGLRVLPEPVAEQCDVLCIPGGKPLPTDLSLRCQLPHRPQ